jgi:PDDEXK-like domain of unknown function (DUF3799)
VNVRELPYGLHPNVSASDYHARIPGLVSKSALDKIRRAPEVYRAWLDGAPDEDTHAMRIGSAFDCALLEPDRFAKEYTVALDFGDCRKKDNKDARDEWRSRHAGAIVLSAEDYETIIGMREKVLTHPLAGKMVAGGQSQLTVRWHDAESGLECKARLDYYSERHAMAVDVKTTEDGSEHGFARSIARYRYHVQQALYGKGMDEVGAPLEHFVFLVVEKSPPYLVDTWVLERDAVDTGMRLAREDMTTLAECMRSGQWPGRPVGIKTIKLPKWAA